MKDFVSEPFRLCCRVALSGSVLLAGCSTVGPDYQAPDATAQALPTGWQAPVPAGAAALELSEWWRQFGSPTMAELIDTALATSPSLEAAVARIVQARANAGIADAAWQPSVSAGTGLSRSRTWQRDTFRSADGTAQPATTTRDHATTRSAVLDMSWELDLFGGRRRHAEASRATAEARHADWWGARVSLAAEVAKAYGERRYCEALQQIAQEDLRSRTETHRLTRQRLDAGFVPAADADRTEASVAEAAGVLKGVQGDCAVLANQLVALTGLDHAQISARLARDVAVLPRPPSGRLEVLPVQAITQRPDVAAAERQLAAASAGIGVAQAARLPSLRLIGSLGINVVRGSNSSVGQYQTETRPWSFGPSLSLPLFDGGKGQAQEAYARGVFAEASANYQSSVRLAVQEVENALVRVDSLGRRLSDFEHAQAGYQRYFAATEALFGAGATSLLALEDARRVLLSSRQSLLSEQLAQLQAWVSLYKAVGGGWTAADLTTASHDTVVPPPSNSSAKNP